jgi:hypothetical protein
VYRDRLHTLNELKAAVTEYITNISQADMQEVFANKIKRVQACIDAHKHHFQHLLLVHSDFPNTLYITVLLKVENRLAYFSHSFTTKKVPADFELITNSHVLWDGMLLG